MLNIPAASNILQTKSENVLRAIITRISASKLMSSPPSVVSVRCIHVLPGQTPKSFPEPQKSVPMSHLPTHQGNIFSASSPRPFTPDPETYIPRLFFLLPHSLGLFTRRPNRTRWQAGECLRPLSSRLHFSTPSRQCLGLTRIEDIQHEDFHPSVCNFERHMTLGTQDGSNVPSQ